VGPVRQVTSAGTVPEATDGEDTDAVNEPTAGWPAALPVVALLVVALLGARLLGAGLLGAGLLGAGLLASGDAGAAPSEVATAWTPRQADRPAIRASEVAERAAALASRPVDERVMAHSSG
jgi:hypothetical protein